MTMVAEKESAAELSLATAAYLEPSPRWVRVEFNGTIIADSRQVLLNREEGRSPMYYFPVADVRMEYLEPTEKVSQFPNKGKTIYWDVQVGDRVADNAAFTHIALPEERSDLTDYVTFKWNEMDAWYEESEEIIVHPRDPYKRLDILKTSRSVRIELDEVTVAESSRPVLLFETGLPTRYYLPREDVNMELLTASESQTGCPYKGFASYYDVEVNAERYHDLVWSYDAPLPESRKIKGLLSFYNEKVDIYVDGEIQERPITHWS
jgi:uncharacterized protein (DUF427 family)